MREARLKGVMPSRFVRTTLTESSALIHADLVKRQFRASAPDQLWVADVTYIPTWAGFIYLAIVLDVFSRKVVGWAIEDHLRTELVAAALDAALVQRRPTLVIRGPPCGGAST